ncbi:MAG: DtxR family transcriptional regulator [Anaerolineales bacterium]|nr:DtxR family transcriptional regulator [Anaerolineales bacterium]MCB8960396.1 DtxR family transcriptional regulator [Ardenticatenales bacterium]
MVDPALALIVAFIVAALLALIFWPRRGLYARWERVRQLTDRVRREDALKRLLLSEEEGQRCSADTVAGALEMGRNEAALLLQAMQADDLVQMVGGELKLTPAGRESAIHIVRAHRLWEHHLAQETGFDATEWHARAEDREHNLAPAELESLAARLGNPTHDPHGDPIPSASGLFGSQRGLPLTQLPADSSATIIHIEDEPEIVFAQLAAAGLTSGETIKVVAADSAEMTIWAGGEQHTLPIAAANNVTVRLLTASQVAAASEDVRSLTTLTLHETGVVAGLSPRCRGVERRRFLDLGILPGTKITAELQSPSGDPTAYRIRGALIALRYDQAALIELRAAEEIAATALAA